MSNVYFASFGGPSASYHSALQRICSEAKQFQLFTKILGYTDIYLKNDTEFWSQHGEFVSSNSRGYGYWLWKSYLIKKLLTTINDGDVIVYADAGCTMNLQGKSRLLEYIDMCKTHESGIVSFQLTHLEKCWTKGDISQYLGASQNDLSTGQLVGGIFILRKCKNTVDLVNKWYVTGSKYNLIDDSPSIVTNDHEFKENRHDQSIWSILRKQCDSVILQDETYFLDWNRDGIKYPIWATRKRG
jgi:hypothetical protein